ncbi:LIC12015 family putative lipoprotein [Leptospira paudalimensis]|uniref:Peptidylprolyl isomerase n=1 Tax=Leptospira paudalimensis TaxID=2950024 RepID=A0ABT3M6R0_9LEPT|nr:hypothetical protein [Leptospira paudalimensis]MCW7504086.1 hypothetical protein [Leptospira paudalimensis]
MIRNKLIHRVMLLGLILLPLINCAKDSEILATFDGGTVTRREMNFVIEASKRGNTEPQPISADIQAKILESIALEKILLKDAIKANKVSEADVTKIESLVKDFLKLNVYMREYVKNGLKSKPLEFINLQLALVRGEDEAENLKKAQDLANRLNTLSDKEVAIEIAKVTDDMTRKPIGGKLEPFCTNCAETPLEDILSEVRGVKQGKFIAYAKQGEGRIAYVVRSLGTEKVHPERLRKYFTSVFDAFKEEAIEYGKTHEDAETKASIAYFTEGESADKANQFASHTMKEYEQGLYQKELKKITEESGITVANLPRFTGPDDVDPKVFTPEYSLYSNKEGKSYTWKDLTADFDAIPSQLKQEYKTEKAKTWDMLNLFQSTILQGKIAETSKRVQNVDSEIGYLMQLDKMKVSLALKSLQDEIKAIPVTVTEAQMRDAYEAGKLYAYSDQDPKNPQNRIPKPYTAVRERIKSEMEGSQRNSFIEQKVSGLKTTYNLVIANDRLKEVTL